MCTAARLRSAPCFNRFEPVLKHRIRKQARRSCQNARDAATGPARANFAHQSFARNRFQKGFFYLGPSELALHRRGILALGALPVHMRSIRCLVIAS